MSSLHVDSGVWGLQGVLTEISGIVGSAYTSDKWDGGKHQGPIREWDEETVGVHVEEVGDIAEEYSQEHHVSHPLCCVDLALTVHFVFVWKILKGSQLIMLVLVVLWGDVVNVVRPVFPNIPKVNLRILAHLCIRSVYLF